MPAGAPYRQGCDRPGGGIGPKLGGGTVASLFPIESFEITVVSNGGGGMPVWKKRLTPAEVKAVVDYTGTGL